MTNLTTLNHVWAMEQSRLETAARLVAANNETPQTASKALRQMAGNIAVVPVYGVIEPKGSIWSRMFGGFGLDEGERQISELLSRSDVGAIVLDIDSPGGSSYGVEEFADFLFEARQRKPIHAVANPLAASAAYWIGTAVSSLTVVPSGDVGSVGVYALHADYSGMLEDAGIKVTIAKAGKYKAEMNPYEPLSDDARDELQARVDEVYTKFVKAVARNRDKSTSVVRSDFGQGRVVSAEQAVKRGMADRIGTLSSVIGRLQGGGSSKRKASMEVLRARQRQRKRLLESG